MKILSKPIVGIIAIIAASIFFGVLVFDSESDLSGLFFATIGGEVVFLGLWLEKEADDETKSGHAYSLKNSNRVKLKSELGWWILMFGIGIEIVVAGWEAYEYEHKMRIVRQEAIKNDPLNQPVSDITAKVVVLLDGTNLPSVKDPFDLRSSNWIMFFSTITNEAHFSSGSVSSLMAEDVLPFVRYRNPNQDPLSHGFVMKYVENMLNPFHPPDEPVIAVRPIAKNFLDVVKILRISPAFIPKDTKVLGGSVSVVINGTIRADFIIPPQGTDPVFSEWNPEFRALVFIATNASPATVLKN